MSYYFAWVDPSDTSFSSAFAREDEKVVSFELAQSEGEFAALTIIIKNPRKGLLTTARKQWAWLSMDVETTDSPQPLFFGRVIAMPQAINQNAVTLQLAARPADFNARKATAADALKVAPYWDPVWIEPKLIDDPDQVLNARSALWDIDRVSHEVTITDVLVPEDGTIDLGTDVLYDSVDVNWGSAPLQSITIDASVSWDQAAVGQYDLTKALLKTAKTSGDGNGRNIKTMTGSGLMQDWPKKGQGIGGNWSFGDCSVTRSDGTVLPPSYQDVVYTDYSVMYGKIGEWPIWLVKPVLNVAYDVTRTYTENLSFTLKTATQAFLIDPADDTPQIVQISSDQVGEPIDAGGSVPIGDRLRRAYFTTARGRQSVDYLICLARARLRSAARAVEIKGETRLSNGIDFSCRKSIRFADPRLPGGEATGKIKSYTLSMDGGRAVAGFVIGCAIGTGSAIAEAAGTPEYAEEGYAQSGWQRYDGQTSFVVSDEVTVADYSNVAPNDDGIDFHNLTDAQVLKSFIIVDGYHVQAEFMNRLFFSFDEIAASLDQLYTEIDMKLNPLGPGPFTTDYDLTVSDLSLPKGIDLEAA